MEKEYREKSLYTIAELTKITGLPQIEIKKCIRQKLISAVEITNRLMWFDFVTLAKLRTIKDLTSEGVTPLQIKKALTNVDGKLEISERNLLHLERRGKKLHIRYDDGTVTDLNGQVELDFSETEGAGNERNRILNFRPESDVESSDWFSLGVDAEEEADLAEAERYYRKELFENGPNPETAFNLANVLYRMNKRPEAIERYRQALEIEPEYVESWNNLGVALSEEGERDGAIEALRRAISIEPRYTDAYYNLAEIYEDAGDFDLATEEWERYLTEDPSSELAEIVKLRIEKISEP